MATIQECFVFKTVYFARVLNEFLSRVILSDFDVGLHAG